VDKLREDGRSFVGGETGDTGCGPVRGNFAITVLKQGDGIETVEELGECLLRVTAIRGEVRACGGKVLAIQYNCAVGVELLGDEQEGFLLSIQSPTFSRSVKVK